MVTVSVILKVSVIRSNETNFYTVSFKSDKKEEEKNLTLLLHCWRLSRKIEHNRKEKRWKKENMNKK